MKELRRVKVHCEFVIFSDSSIVESDIFVTFLQVLFWK